MQLSYINRNSPLMFDWTPCDNVEASHAIQTAASTKCYSADLSYSFSYTPDKYNGCFICSPFSSFSSLSPQFNRNQLQEKWANSPWKSKPTKSLEAEVLVKQVNQPESDDTNACV